MEFYVDLKLPRLLAFFFIVLPITVPYSTFRIGSAYYIYFNMLTTENSLIILCSVMKRLCYVFENKKKIYWK